MPKVISSRRQEGEAEKAQEFIRTYVLFPSSILGLVAIVFGVGGLGYQLFTGSYGWETFTYSSALLVVGVLLGLAQTKYQQYLLREFPGYFAQRMKAYTQRSIRKAKKNAAEIHIDHRGRGLVPLWYCLGIGLMVTLAGVCIGTGFLSAWAAFALPWAGYFWAKMFFWKGLVLPPGHKGR